MNIDTVFENTKLELGRHLRALRLQKEYSAQVFAEAAAIYRPKVNSLENGRENPEFKTIIKLAIGFGVELADLFDFSRSQEVSFKVKKQELEDRFLAEKLKFSKRLFDIMELRGINQPRLSVMADISEADITLIKQASKNFRLLQVVKLSIALRVELRDLFDYEGPLPD